MKIINDGLLTLRHSLIKKLLRQIFKFSLKIINLTNQNQLYNKQIEINWFHFFN